MTPLQADDIAPIDSDGVISRVVILLPPISSEMIPQMEARNQ